MSGVKHPESLVINDTSCMKVCKCVLSKSTEGVIDLTNSISSDEVSTDDTMWVHTSVYSLTIDDKQIVLSPSGWLSDSIISSAAQKLMLHFPLISGLQPPML